MTNKGVVVRQLEELLEPIKKDLGVINKKLDQHSKKLDQHQRNFDDINEKLDFHKDNLEEINKKQDQHTRSLVNIENKIGAYGDMYQINNDNVRKLEKRIDVLEDKEGVAPPPGLRLANFGP